MSTGQLQLWQKPVVEEPISEEVRVGCKSEVGRWSRCVRGTEVEDLMTSASGEALKWGFSCRLL